MAEIAIPIAVLGGMYIISNKNNRKETFKSQINNYVKPPIVNYPKEVRNDLLNETAQGDTNLDSGNAPVSLAQPFSTGEPMTTDTTGMPDSVADAVTRDYSGLMKAIAKKKGR